MYYTYYSHWPKNSWWNVAFDVKNKLNKTTFWMFDHHFLSEVKKEQKKENVSWEVKPVLKVT